MSFGDEVEDSGAAACFRAATKDNRHPEFLRDIENVEAGGRRKNERSQVKDNILSMWVWLIISGHGGVKKAALG